MKYAKSTASHLTEGLDYRGRRVYGRIYFGTRHHIFPLKMVEVTGDTDGTVEFDCAILNAGRPGAVKCSTQCRHCEVTFEKGENGGLSLYDNDNGVDDDSTQESEHQGRFESDFIFPLLNFDGRVSTSGGKTIQGNRSRRLRLRTTPSEIFCGTFVAIYTVLSYWTSGRKPRKENQPS